MHLADSSTSHSTANSSANFQDERSSGLLLEPNQSTYLRLKLSLSLNLRRQIFLAVCDDLALRNRLAAQLYTDLAYSIPSAPEQQPHPQARYLSPEDNSAAGFAYPRLVSLTLNFQHPNPITQVTQWLSQYPLPKGVWTTQPPAFQILGAEQLTRQTGAVQRQFLYYLQQIGQSSHALDYTLLLWLTKPWFHAVQQSAPAFWQTHTALFEFAGDPTPSIVADPSTPSFAPAPIASPPIVPVDSSKVGTAISTLNGTLNESSEQNSTDQNSTPNSPEPDLTEPSIDATQFWNTLSQDLARLDQRPPSRSVQPPTSDVSSSVEPSSVEPSIAPPPDPQPPSIANFQVTAEVAEIAKAEAEIEVAEIEVAETPQVAETANTPHVAEIAEIAETSEVAEVVEVAETTEIAEVAETTELKEPVDRPFQPQRRVDNQLAELVQISLLNSQVSHSDVRAALSQIGHLHQQAAPASAIAAAYQNLGNLYRDRIEQGELLEATLTVAIAAYSQALVWLEEASPLWSDLLNDIGNLHWMRSRQMPDVAQGLAELDQSIAAYQLALKKTEATTRSTTYAMIQNNLGSALADLARYRDPSTSLQQAIAAYTEALQHRKAEDDPARYAATQNNLGTAYWNLAQHNQPVLHLQQAIAAYAEALQFYSQTRDPMHYAMIQNNLGTAYWNLAQYAGAGDRIEGVDQSGTALLLQKAVTAYQTALVHRTLEAAPTAHAATQNNLGTAFWHLSTLANTPPADRAHALHQAIVAYQGAIAAIQKFQTQNGHAPTLTFDPFATHNNLGLAFYQVALDKHTSLSPTERLGKLESALHHHLQALQGWQQQPDFYQAAFGNVVQTVRAFYSECGMKGQTLALSKVPGHLLSELMKRL